MLTNRIVIIERWKTATNEGMFNTMASKRLTWAKITENRILAFIINIPTMQKIPNTYLTQEFGNGHRVYWDGFLYSSLMQNEWVINIPATNNSD